MFENLAPVRFTFRYIVFGGPDGGPTGPRPGRKQAAVLDGGGLCAWAPSWRWRPASTPAAKHVLFLKSSPEGVKG